MVSEEMFSKFSAALSHLRGLDIGPTELVGINMSQHAIGCHLYECAFIRVAALLSISEVWHYECAPDQLRFNNGFVEFVTIVASRKVEFPFAIRCVTQEALLKAF